ncbi:b(0,+)-type amino acid transporter 1-like [Amphibalanus amphitrite]|uniref:b(0,+)-type amino acid transporter 1-like n=1 Tax=Amphibalanus amphitrite TaxID=1232801 RepID=UPI001C91F740|nr:b(0,+)-type amino acid transporter 1-like [Amphibalanus amphitrite]
MENAGYVADDSFARELKTADQTTTARAAAAAASRRRQKEQQLAAGAAVQLPRTIGALSGSAILIGSIVGAGIFISPAGVLRHSGSVGAALTIWLVCGLVEAVGALCYIELGLLLPEHGGDFTYLLRAFGPLHPFLGALPAFLHCWLDVNVSNPGGTAVLALTFAQYCVRPWYGSDCSPPVGLESLLAALIVLTLTAANCIGVHWSTRLQSASTVAKMTAMAIIVAGGVYSLSQGNVHHLATGYQGTTSSSGELAAAFLTCLWAYGGWKNLNNITEEVKNPPRTLPLSILGSLPIVTLFYIMVNIAYLAVLSPEQMMSSHAVAFTFGERVLGPAAFLMPLGVALSVFGSLNSAALSCSRVMMAVAREGHHLHAFSLVHVRWLTPVPALIFHALVTCSMILIGDVGTLLRLAGFVGSFFNVMVLVALFVLRRTMPDAKRPYRMPTVLAALRLLFSAYLLVGPIVDHPRTEYLYSVAMLLLGLTVYTPFVYKGWSWPLLERCTVGLQKALELLPTEH